MLVFSDRPGAAAELGAVGSGAVVHVRSLLAADAALWRALGSGDRPWRGTVRDPGPPGYWSRALVVAEAAASQFDRLRALLAGGLRLPGPTACLTLHGRGFRGQRGRPWVSAPGNLHLSAALPEPGLAARDAPSLPMLPAVALVDALRALGGGALRPGIKWVNDVLLDGRKIGGVLTSTEIQRERVVAVLFGIGLNVAIAPPVPPTPFVPAVGSLAEAGVSATLADVATAVLSALAARLRELLAAGPAPLLEAYRAVSVVIGRRVCVFQEPETAAAAEARPLRILHGTVRAIAPDLSLALEGVERPVASGRLAFAEDCPRFGF